MCRFGGVTIDRRPRTGILGGPIDLDGPKRPRRTYVELEATPGLVVKQRGAPTSGEVLECLADRVLVRDRHGAEHWMALAPGGFEVDGTAVTLVRPRPDPGAPSAVRRTASGSLTPASTEARVARASRLLVEGKHDAELVERVWGVDLRAEGIVVELLDGADHLEEAVRTFGPGPHRRLGVLLDHLVDGSKEQRIAERIDHPDVLIVGHPFIDIWQAVKPSVLGIAAWPDVPKGTPWKEGTIAALGSTLEPSEFWRALLARLDDWTQLEAPLIGAVESLIDFVSAPG
jgi:hypothetical protein